MAKRPAVPDAWKTLPMTEPTAELAFERAFSVEEMRRLKDGLVPTDMEDKWFIVYVDGDLRFHRSWTGHHIYTVHLAETEEGAGRITGVTVTRDPAVYRGDETLDRATLTTLLEFLVELPPKMV